MTELDRLGWVVYKTFEIGRHLVGVRTNSEEAGRWLTDVLGTYEVDEEAEPFFSVWVPEPSRVRSIRRFHILYQEAGELTRSHSPGEIGERLIAELAKFAFRQRDDAVYLDAVVVERDGSTALIPAEMVDYLLLDGRAKREIAIPARTKLGLTFDGRLFQPPQVLNVPEDAGAQLALRVGARAPARAPEQEIPPVVDVLAPYHYDPQSPDIMAISRAVTVHAFAQYVLNLPVLGTTALEALAELAAHGRGYALQSATVDGAIDSLISVLDGDPMAAAASV